MPIPEIMIDNTFGYERMSFMDGFSGYIQIKMSPENEKLTSFRTQFGVYCYTFMDGFSGYNQIKMSPEDEKHTSFMTTFEVYCYTIMPFGPKIAGATYQRAMMKIFQVIRHKTVECYVDAWPLKAIRRALILMIYIKSLNG